MHKEGGYFDVSAHTKPLMHLWSLALEEQFYIFCPLVLYFACKKGLNIISICVGIIFLSFVVSIQTLYKQPIEAFYYPLCRAWELTSGVLLAYLTFKGIEIPQKAKAKRNLWLNLSIYKPDSVFFEKTLTEAKALFGLILIFCSIIFLEKTSDFPGWYALLPVVGALLVISSGENAWVNRNILSSKSFVGIGLISYPLYLWHWPLLSFTWIIEGSNVGWKVIVGILLISFVLAWITYKFIEKPIKALKNAKRTSYILVGLVVLLGLGAFAIVINKGCKFRKANLFSYISLLPGGDESFVNLEVLCSSPINKSLEKYPNWNKPFCIVNSDKPKFLVLGDSHAMSFVHSASINNDLDIAMINLNAQPPYINYVVYQEPIFTRDNRIRDLKLLNSSLNIMITTYKSIEYVVLVSRGPVYFSGNGFGIETQDPNYKNFKIGNIYNAKQQLPAEEAFVEGYVEMIEFLLLKGKKVIFAIDYPELGKDPLLCLKRPFSFTERQTCILDRKIVDKRQEEYRVLVERIKQKVPSLLVYDPILAFCDQDKCYGKRNDIIYYGDDDHLNLDGSRLLTNHFTNWFINEAISN